MDDPQTQLARVPPALIGAILLLTVVLAIVFYVAAQVVHTP
jgi:hypothetical protein